MANQNEPESSVPRLLFNGKGALSFGWVGGVLLFVVLSGLLVWILPFSAGSQWTLLFHTVSGLIVLIPFSVWQLSHWLATRKTPRHSRKISAYIGFWLLAVSIAAGAVVTYQAAFDTFVSHGWLKVHLWTGAFALPFLIWHLIPQAREKYSANLAIIGGPDAPDYGPGRRKMWKRAFAVSAALLALIGIASVAYRPPSFDDYKPPASFRPAAGPNPFAPSNAETETSKPISPQVLAKSSGCGAAGCHKAIYDEWRASAHHWSEEDQFFQAVRKATTEVQGTHATEKCGGCHGPVSLLSGYKDPRLGKATAGYLEGDSCIVCHAVRRVDERGIGSYVLGIPRPYLFQYADSQSAGFLYHFLIRVYPAQHDRDYDLTIARQAESCAPCHKEYDVVGNYRNLLEVETQYDDWKRNKWNTDTDPSKRLRCQQCHMYEQKAPNAALTDPYDLELGPGLTYHNHRFAAANQFMPLALALPDAAEQVREVNEWLTGQRRVPEIETVWPRGPLVSLTLRAPASARPGQSVELQVILTNNKVGHSFPTGPLNIVRVWIELEARDRSGNLIYHSGELDPKNHVEAGSYVLRPIAITEQGQTIMTPDIWHPNGLRYRPAIPPQQSQAFDYQFKAPRDAVWPLRVEAHLRYRKANQFFVDEVYPNERRTMPITDISAGVTEVTLRGR